MTLEMEVASARSLLREMTERTPTRLWCDGCDPHSLRESLARGATGATCNPVLVMQAVETDPVRWRTRILEWRTELPSASEEELTRRLVVAITRRAAAVLEPIFTRTEGREGRISVQLDPRGYGDPERMIEEGLELADAAPNVAVKVPTTTAGLVAIEELTAHGVTINATVSFSVSHALAAAQAVERGLARARAPRPSPWVTIMAGRIDDYLRDCARTRGMDGAIVRHASTAIVRRTYQLFRARGYHSTLLVAAMRSHHHWSEFVGGDLVVTITPEWQLLFDASGVDVRPRIDEPIEPGILGALTRMLPDFVRAYEEGGLRNAELDTFGPTLATLRQFNDASERLRAWVAEVARESAR